MGAIIGKENLASITNNIPGLTTYYCAILGLDTAGKTTVLYRLKFDQYVNAAPTIGFNCEKIRCPGGKSKGTTFLMWDVGGQEKLRPLWRSYTRCTDGIIFVVDSTKTERLEEAKLELLKICKTHKQSHTPVLILANKQDLPVAIDIDKIEASLGVKELGTSIPWHLQSTCAVTGEGLDEGMDILHEMILSNRKRCRQNAFSNNHALHNKPQRRKVRRSLSHHH